ncbi:MAG TPA: SulP family inorganic anion transporter, partial [Sandaracinaceae bacterium]
IEAMDKLDPYKRRTPTNRELAAQGLGNLLCGLLGGLPMTAVVVRGSTNIHAGARTRMSAFLHGVLLLAAVVLLPAAMNLIPLAALAAILLHVGYKLAPVSLFLGMARQPIEMAKALAGRIVRRRPIAWDELEGPPVEQWLPFFVTVGAILATDLLKGVGVGMAVAIFFILRAHMKVPYFMHREESKDADSRTRIRIELTDNVSFLNKAALSEALHELPDRARVEIDGRGARYIHPDVLELIQEFAETAHTRGIDVELVAIPSVEPLGTH